MISTIIRIKYLILLNNLIEKRSLVYDSMIASEVKKLVASLLTFDQNRVATIKCEMMNR